MRKLVCLGILALIMSGCVRFQPRPVTAPGVFDDFEARRLDSPGITAFLGSRPDSGGGLAPYPSGTSGP